MGERIVIVGGVAGGATAAARLRRRDESLEILMFERGDYISYANCGLPYYIGDVITQRDSLLLQQPEDFRKKYNVDVRTGSEVTNIDPKEKSIEVYEKKADRRYRVSYDKLILATGSSPLTPPIPGIDGAGIFTLWTIPDTDRLKSYVQARRPESAVVVGGGFIGLEMAENLHRLGIAVTIVEMQHQVMPPLDPEMAGLIHADLCASGVQLILGDGVKSFHPAADGTTTGSKSRTTAVSGRTTVSADTPTRSDSTAGTKAASSPTDAPDRTVIELTSGRRVTADLVLLSIGVRPNSALAASAGLKVNRRGGIVVDEYLKTSEADIYAIGDVVEVSDPILTGRTMIPLAGPANKQGRIVADNLTGAAKTYKGTLGTSVARVFDLSVAATGRNEKQLAANKMQKGRDYYTALINQKSHAGYYPDAVSLTLKLLFSREGKIFGAQIVGADGADKRIDTIASVMRTDGTVHDLTELELAYAPPYSSAKDPVNMLGYTAENILDGMVSFIEWDELDAMLADPGRAKDCTVLDVTEDVERMVYAIPGSAHIPLGQLRKRLGELDKNKTIITYCAIGVRSYNAARILVGAGFTDVRTLSGGLSFYKTMHRAAAAVAGKAWEDQSETSPAGTGNQTESHPDQAGAQSGARAAIRILDCSGLQCPGPIMKVNEALRDMADGETIEVSATDMGFCPDIEAWCRRTGNTLRGTKHEGRIYTATVQKGSGSAATQPGGTGSAYSGNSATDKLQASGRMAAGTAEGGIHTELPQGKTLIVFSGDLDRVLASFIIANGAAAMGRPVTMFFTFWGLNVLRRPKGARVHKPFIDRMFGAMMPKGVRKLKLSKLNMAGMGSAMMKKVMRDKNVDSLETLIKKAQENGVRMVACTMSMDVMGIRKEELIDGIEYAGVATFLGDAEESNVNLFV